ncbi:hypothetical protein MAPG_04648 [Magnaporthiopsis poae ATCC 64411]|uniref:Uncharacterized protein n=1 Tax=Magnaporthiopsis poae (strain ATCC 64411 / 73-15) TaxID=644358 RepID=A0A0C4DXA7_MAGP6|nr:hypothetical protein MAPG_04648 [Magnaporthiopsis poae ATCC 64411]
MPARAMPTPTTRCEHFEALRKMYRRPLRCWIPSADRQRQGLEPETPHWRPSAGYRLFCSRQPVDMDQVRRMQSSPVSASCCGWERNEASAQKRNRKKRALDVYSGVSPPSTMRDGRRISLPPRAVIPHPIETKCARHGLEAQAWPLRTRLRCESMRSYRGTWPEAPARCRTLDDYDRAAGLLTQGTCSGCGETVLE